MLDSGIQEECGGVARFHRSETGSNKPISTEITGYFAGILVWLFGKTGEEEYLDRARKAARFLIDHVWDAELGTFPFEHPSPTAESRHQAYFFDNGIIVRGLLAVWRATKQQQFLDVARAAARGLIADFRSGGEYHPILDLPGKGPAPRTTQWSKSPGCYQLKAALSWWEIADATGEKALRDAYLDMLNATLVTHAGYLPGSAGEHATMDRLHAYSYFLEGLTPMLERVECARAFMQGIFSVSRYLREIAPSFARADVYAQLLRARIYGAEATSINREAAAEEACKLTAFQAESDDPRVDGGFLFGRRDGLMSSHVNPVSTAFAIQALEMWREFQTESKTPCSTMLV